MAVEDESGGIVTKSGVWVGVRDVGSCGCGCF